MGETKTSWNLPLVATSMDAKSPRVSVEQPGSYRLIGVDGQLDGPLRPFPGFEEVHQLQWSNWGSNHDSTSRIVELVPVNFVVATSGYAYGFLYRVERKNGSAVCDIFVDYFNSALGFWVRGKVVATAVPTTPERDPVAGRQMSVSVFGRFVYVFVEDAEPVSFTTGEGPLFTYTLLSNTGPGKQPTLLSPKSVVALGDRITTGDANRPGAGQVRLLEFKPSEVGLFTGTPHQSDDAVVGLDPGDYAFAYILHNSANGRRSALSEVAECREDDFDQDGSSGPLDPVRLYAAIEICWDHTKYDQAYIYRSVRVQSAGGTYVASILHLDRIITLEDYATSNNPLADTSLSQAIYWYELEDKQLVYQDTYSDKSSFDEDIPKGGASLWYEGTMLVSSIRSANVSAEDRSRAGDAIRGIGELRWSSLTEPSPELFPPSSRYIPNLPSNDIIVMRAVGPNVIGFSRDRQYHIRKESVYLKVTEMHEGFGCINNKAADTVGSLVYFLTSKGMKSVDSQGQLDDVRSINEIVVDHWRSDLLQVSIAFDAGLSALFVQNSAAQEACVFWFNTAKVTMLKDVPFGNVSRGVWPQDFVYDRDNLLASAGVDNDTYFNPLVERAFFYQNPELDASNETNSTYGYRIFQVRRRTTTQTGGHFEDEPQITTLPLTGDACFRVTGMSTNTITVDNGTYTVPQDAWGARVYVLKSATPSLVGKKAIVKKTTTNTLVLRTTGDLSYTELSGLAADDWIGISPIYFEWQGAPVAAQDENGQQFGSAQDYFKVKHISAIGCAFSDVSGTALSVDPEFAIFYALAFRGSGVEPDAIATPLDPSDGTTVRSVSDDSGIYYAAFKGTTQVTGRFGISGSTITVGVRIVCPNLDFRLMGVRVSGDVRDTYRAGRVP